MFLTASPLFLHSLPSLSSNHQSALRNLGKVWEAERSLFPTNKKRGHRKDLCTWEPHSDLLGFNGIETPWGKVNPEMSLYTHGLHRINVSKQILHSHMMSCSCKQEGSDEAIFMMRVSRNLPASVVVRAGPKYLILSTQTCSSVRVIHRCKYHWYILDHFRGYMDRALNNIESRHWEVTHILLLFCLFRPRRKVSQYGANVSLFSLYH